MEQSEKEITVPRDEFSTELRRLRGNPVAVEKQSVVELADFYGNLVTWIVKSIRVDGSDTVFLQRQDAAGATRLVLPAEVTAALVRQRDGAVTVNRRRGARSGAAKRKAAGVPAFGGGAK